MKAYIVTAIVVSDQRPNADALTWDGGNGEVIHSSVEDLSEWGPYALEKLAEVDRG